MYTMKAKLRLRQMLQGLDAAGVRIWHMGVDKAYQDMINFELI